MQSHESQHEPGSLREFLHVAFPLIISNASLALMQFVSRIYLSWSSPEDIAASLPAGILAYTMISLFMGIAAYTNTLVAQAYGAGHRTMVARAVWQGILFAIGGGLAALTLIPFGLWVLEGSGHGAEIVAREKTYFTWLMSGCVIMIMQAALSSYFSGIGRTGTVMRVSIIGNVVNAVLDYGLIFGALGMPKLGIAGAALAANLATLLMVVIYATLFLSEESEAEYQTRSQRGYDPVLMRTLVRFGTPSGIQFLLDISAFTVFIFLIGKLGPVELATSNIVLSLNTLAFFPMIGAHIATSTLVGQYVGRGRTDIARKCTYTSLFAVELYMLVFGLVYLIFPQQLMHLFASEQAVASGNFHQVEKLGAELLVLVALYQAFDAMILTFSGSLKGAGDTRFAMWACILCAWAFFVPGTWLALNVFDWGVRGAWLWATFYLTLLGGIYFWRFESGHWKDIRLLDFSAPPAPAPAEAA